MPEPIEDGHRKAIAPRLVALVVAATLPALVAFPADARPVILRVALAAGLVILLCTLIGRLLASFRSDDPDSFEPALEPPAVPVRLDATLAQLRDEIRHSRSSRRYFEKVLWPRLRTLAARRGLATEDQPPPQPTGWRTRRGPSIGDLNQLVDHLETRR